MFFTMFFNLNFKKSVTTIYGIYLYNVRTHKMLICHSMFDSWINWSIPNGNIKSDEDTYACASRVVKEKTGIDLQNYTVLNMFSLTPTNCKFQTKIMECSLVLVDFDSNSIGYKCSSTINDYCPEIDNWKWITLDLAKQYLHVNHIQNINTIEDLVEMQLVN